MTPQQIEKRRVEIQRVEAYKAFFESDDGQLILEDLAKFCSASTPTFERDDPNGRISAFREGRRDVYLRIRAHADMTREQIADYANQVED